MDQSWGKEHGVFPSCVRSFIACDSKFPGGGPRVANRDAVPKMQHKSRHASVWSCKLCEQLSPGKNWSLLNFSEQSVCQCQEWIFLFEKSRRRTGERKKNTFHCHLRRPSLSNLLKLIFVRGWVGWAVSLVVYTWVQMPQTVWRWKGDSGFIPAISFYSANVASLCLREANGSGGKNISGEWVGLPWDGVPPPHISQ